MKSAMVIAVALATFSSFPSPAQQQPAQQQQPMQQQQDQQMQQQSPPATPPGAPSQQQAQQGAAAAAPSASAADLKPVTAELVGKLDSTSAKQGDNVVVKTKQDLKIAGGAEIPKGSKLLGHVTNAQSRGDGKENSQIAIQFDRAELKGGQTVAIESVIQSVSPATGSGADNSTPGANGVSPASPGATSSSPGMNGSSSSTNQSTANNRPGLASNTTAQQGQTDQNTNSGMPAPGSIVARQGNIAIRMTAVPGVLLANDINGLPFRNASGLLVGAQRDIQLDEGTQMVLAVAGTPQGAGGGMSR